MTPFLSAALDYANRGVRVFPIIPLNPDGHCACDDPSCDSPGKHPLGQLVPHGFRDATTDAVTIRQWWAVWPDANVAVQTGACSGLIVVDVDAKSGGWQSAARLEAEHGAWPITPTVETGGGGAHLWFQHPGGTVPSSAGRIAPGIDLRADGGYVVVPPSRHRSGTSYRWVSGLALEVVPHAEIPAWLRGCIAKPATRQSAIKLAHDELLAEGGRNDRLMRIGAALRRYGLTQNEISTILHTINAARCRPPLDAAEVGRIAASVSRYTPAPQQASVRPARRPCVEYIGGRVVRR